VRGRRFTLAVLAALILCSAGGIYIESVTRVRQNGGMYLAFGLAVVWAFVIAGLIAWRRRPGNRTGLLMIAIGFAWLTSAFTDAPNDLLFTIGLVLSNFWPALLVHLLLSYPSGYLDRRSRWIVIVTYLDTVVISTLMLPFSEPRVDGGVNVHSAHNLLLVSHQPGLVSALQLIAVVVAVPLVILVLFTVVSRWRSASAASRRVLGPMYLTGAVAIAVLGLVVGLVQAFGLASQSLTFFAISVVFTAIPVGYLLGILRTRLDRSNAVGALAAVMREQRAPGGLRDALRVALNDPTLELAYRRPGSEEYVDVAGEHYALPGESAGRGVTTIEHHGEVVAALVHDPVLLDDPGLIDAVCGPAGLAIENERLQAELRAQFQEVSVSERRLRDVLENVHLIAVSLDLEGRITFANQYFADLTGWTREQLLGRLWLDRFPGGDPHFVDRVKNDDILVHDQMPLTTKAGDVREIAWSNTLTRDVDGVICGSTSIGQDVTEQNRSGRQEESLRRIATMVAIQAPADDIFHTVTEDIAHLLGAQTSNMIRFDGPKTGTVVAGWSEPDATTLPVGDEVVFDGPTAVPIVRRTGKATRVDDYSDIDGELAERLRGLGLRSTVSAPVTVDGRVWGAITVSTIGESKLPPDAETRIVQFTELVAVALSTAEARSQLAGSRARIVAAGDAERRRLERNLHDGAQQRLVSLALGIRMARSSVEDGSEAAALLESASVELAEALAELRELARGIHPAVLTDRGLESAVGALTDRSSVPVKVSLQLPHRLPSAVEAAVYYVIAEALTNVTKYAEATSVEVTVAADNGLARVEVIDDGLGGADPTRGSGLNGLTDRVEALDGRLQVISHPGKGTRVLAELPLLVGAAT
jgi:PAS domain S-box-containing protein